MNRGALLVLLSAYLVGVPSQATADRVSARDLLDRYQHGDRRAVVTALTTLGNLQPLASDLWGLVAEAGGRQAPRSLRLAVAGLALEAAAVQWWPREIDPLIELGCGLLQGDPPDAIERAWQLAAVAAFQRGRDDGFLVVQGGFGKALGARAWPLARPDHIAHALMRFPGDPRLRLAAAAAAAVTADSEPPRDEVWVRSPSGAESVRRSRALRSIAMFEDLVRVPGVAAEAELRIGQLRLALHAPADALPHFVRARSAADPFLAYLAHFLAGRALDRLERHGEAQDEYQAALVLVPHAQSAVEAYAANAFLEGRRDQSYALIKEAFETKPRPQDPWRQFGYGDARLLPGLLDALHEAIR